MRFRRTLAVALAGAAAAAGIAISAGVTAEPARADTTSVSLPISAYSHMLLDPAHQHIFFSSGTGSTSILVTDYSGNTVATIPNEPGATGLALSSDGSTVYAALVDGDAVSAISTSTLAETARYATGTDAHPTYVAYTSGKIWFSYGSYGDTSHGIGSIDPATDPATVNLDAVQSVVWYWGWAPILAASPNGELVAAEPEEEPGEMVTFDVSSGTATVLAPPQPLSNSGFLDAVQITPDGKDVVTSGGQVFQVSDLSAVSDYSPYGAGSSVSIASDGTVAVGTTGFNTSGVWMYGNADTPIPTDYFGGGYELGSDAVALTPDARELFVVTVLGFSNGEGSFPELNIVSNPAQVPSQLNAYGPTTAVKHGQPITITGGLVRYSTLYGGSLWTTSYAGGQTLTVTRIDPANPNGVALPDITTAADGTFSFTDTPPKANVDSGTVTYQLSYAGDAHLTSAAASASVTVQYTGS